jgi:hypothetical protein
MRRLAWAFTLGVVSALVVATGALADTNVTDRAYVRHDGGVDPVIASCGNDGTGPLADRAGAPVDDFGGERQANEPALAVKPDEASFMVASSNDYCTVPYTQDAWQGIYTSNDGGMTWMDSLLPGYPGDTSAEGAASPLNPQDQNSGDPLLDWDLDGHLYAGGIAFNRTVFNPSGFVSPANGNVYASTWVRDPASPLGINYLRTVIVGRGTPGRFDRGTGRFNDRPAMKADDWPTSPCKNNVYMSWTLFPGGGQDYIQFARSTNHGQSFSHPIKISKGVASAQGSDIAVGPDGTVYVMWRQFAFNPNISTAIVYTRSTDCGATFSNPRIISSGFVPSDRSDVIVDDGGTRNCGDGPLLCVTNFVFHRISTFASGTVDWAGNLYVSWSQVAPVASNGDTYRPDGRSYVVVAKLPGGTGAPVITPVTPAAAIGHQFWPDLGFDQSTSEISLIYYDSLEDPSYSAVRPPGNEADATSPCQGAGGVATQPCNVLNTYIATSLNGLAWAPTKVSTVGHQPNFEMFSDRQSPFHGDYLWVDSAQGLTYGVWTDNRDVVPGADPREATQDGFDVLQCRLQTSPGVWSSDRCANAGGLDQNIYGAVLP